MTTNVKAATLTAIVCTLIVGTSVWRGLAVLPPIDLAKIEITEIGTSGDADMLKRLADAFERDAVRAQRYIPNGAMVASQRKIWCMGWKTRRDQNLAYPPSCELLDKQAMPESVTAAETGVDYKTWMTARNRWNPEQQKFVSLLTRESACVGWEQKKRMNVEYYRFCDAPLKPGESMTDTVPKAWLDKENADADQRYYAANPWRAKQDAEIAARVDAQQEEGVVVRELRRMGYSEGLRRQELVVWLSSAMGAQYVPSFKTGCTAQPVDKRSAADKTVCDVIEGL